jgi:hypothetical protein
MTHEQAIMLGALDWARIIIGISITIAMMRYHRS